MEGLWFDVENKRYTTVVLQSLSLYRCGLMQKTKDIQHFEGNVYFITVVV